MDEQNVVKEVPQTVLTDYAFDYILSLAKQSARLEALVAYIDSVEYPHSVDKETALAIAGYHQPPMCEQGCCCDTNEEEV